MTSRSVLISGAGVAGPTLAYWLARHGFQPTVVERSQGLRSSGNPVDVRGPAMPVAEGMGIVDELRAAATHPTAMQVIDAAGRLGARVAMPSSDRSIEIPRGSLAAVLYGAAKDRAEFLFDDTIVDMAPDADGVDVTFDRAAPRRFDLVVGADGLHSNVRRLAFGPELEFVRHMGVYVATMPLGEAPDRPYDVLMFNTPGRLVSIHPCRGEALAAFIFRGPAIDGFDHHDTDQHKRFVADAYAGVGWRVPELLARLRDTDDLYFDSVSLVTLSSWARGRVALVGDSASCVSLFGEGSSLALSGAATLASALAGEADVATALRQYETRHRILVEPRQRGINRAATLLIPKTRLGIAARNLVARALPASRGARAVEAPR
jgi:2-polyprenyl-6-methoxyphenol hydroxylase-like FAD-dependent oxidoreductase